MNEKMKRPPWTHKKINIRPPNYSKENFLAIFTPQTQLKPEQIFWSKDVFKMKTKALAEQAKAAKPVRALTVYPPNTPVKLVLRVLPRKSQVKINIFALIQLFLEFEKTCKTRITPTGLTEGERCFEQTKECYLIEVIPFFKTLKENFKGIQKSLTKEIKEIKAIFDELEAEVDQNAVNRKVNNCTDASGSKPRNNTKKNRISLATSVKRKTVEDHPRTNKSNLKKPNHVDSFISSKRTVINLNSDSVCQTCNKCFILANHDMCVIKYLNFVNASSSVKNIMRKVKQVWKPKPVKQVWKATGKVRTNVGYQWQHTGRIFTLGEQCPLTRFTQTKVVPAKQLENVSICKIVVIENLSHTSHKPLTRYQHRNKLNKAVPVGMPTLTDTSTQPVVVLANQLESNNN
nr:hypothetical protein [Tanacetum cinerariifolium]GFA66742.1 hypothetical protein [Tanacetum cinerariifolium]